MFGSLAVRGAAALLGAAMLASVARGQGAAGGCAGNTLTPAEQRAGWRSLFDGKTTSGWRAYRGRDVPVGWQVVNGALMRVAGGAGDIVTTGEYRDFELALDWNIAPGGNSGIFYRATESEPNVYESAPEMQILDDERFRPDGLSLLTSAGSDFGLYPTRRGVVKPAGQWNHVLIVVRGDHVEHWLNGVKVVDYELGSPDWKARVARSKFAAWPRYGTAPRGHIALQDHGSWVAFRNIRIRELP